MSAAFATDRQDPTSEANDTRAVRPPSLARRLSSTTAFYIFLVDIALVLFFSIVSPDNNFATSDNFTSVLRYTTTALLLALGLALMMSATVFDLSLGANLVLSSVAGALTLKHLGATSDTGPTTGHVGAVIVALFVCVAAGSAFGLVNGLVITRLRVNPLIATLATLGIGTGLALVLTDGADVAGLPSALQQGFGLKTVAHVPVPMLVALVVAAGLWALFRYTRFGLRTLAIGSNHTAADRAGLRVSSHLVVLTALGGALAGLAGFIDLATYAQTSVGGHALDGLNAATAVVIGGTALIGGRVSIIGTVWGALLAAILLTGLIVQGVSSFYQQIVIGGILIAAVALDQVRFRRRNR
jgi:ribose transport system permease protein